jgi:hypothetical protein
MAFGGIFTFLVECYPLYAASALGTHTLESNPGTCLRFNPILIYVTTAANSFARSSFAAGFPLFGVQMYEKLGYQVSELSPSSLGHS